MIVIMGRKWILASCLVPLFCLGAISQTFHSGRAGSEVLIDAGHGGIDGGCQDMQGHLEKDLNLAIAQETASFLGQAGYQAKLTRADDRELGPTYGQDLQARLDAARRLKVAALVSVHANWFHDPAAQGSVAIIPPGSPASAALARAIIARLTGVCPYAKPEPEIMGDHPLLATESFPIVLVEVGFLSNPAEAARLQTIEYRRAIAQAMALGVKDFLQAGRAQQPRTAGAAPGSPRTGRS